MLYILLQLAYLVAIPHSLLAHGWRGINFTSPFGQLAVVVNLGWLSGLLYADAVLSQGWFGQPWDSIIVAVVSVAAAVAEPALAGPSQPR